MSKYDIDFDPSELKNGAYEIFWKDTEGGMSSIASVGRDRSGKVWMAPSNWVGGVQTFDWSHVSSVRRIDIPNESQNIVLTRIEDNGNWVSYSISPNAAYNTQIIRAAIERIEEAYGR